MDARDAAYQALRERERKGVLSPLGQVLERAGLEARDAALCSTLYNGVLQHELLLDYYLGQFSQRSLRRLETSVLLCLRLGAFQLLYLDRVPHSAAVNESVRLCRRYARHPGAAGLVNGILRTLERNLSALPDLPRGSAAQTLSLRFSHPQWLVERLLSRFGPEDTERLLDCHNRPASLYAQVNFLKTTPGELSQRLLAQGVRAEPHPCLENCLLLEHSGSLETLEPFREGLFYIQDPASRLAVLACGPQPGERLLDLCAAPGGKSFAAAVQMEDRGELLSCDVTAQKVRRITQGAQRLGLKLPRGLVSDGLQFRPEWEGHFDRVLVDAPCSGLGVIRKKPDIRYKDPEELRALPELQLSLLSQACRYVRPGGCLLYSTCTLLEEENEALVGSFLSRHPEFSLVPFDLPGPVGRVEGGMLTLLPYVYDTDGFFIARMERDQSAA